MMVAYDSAVVWESSGWEPCSILGCSEASVVQTSGLFWICMCVAPVLTRCSNIHPGCSSRAISAQDSLILFPSMATRLYSVICLHFII